MPSVTVMGPDGFSASIYFSEKEDMTIASLRRKLNSDASLNLELVSYRFGSPGSETSSGEGSAADANDSLCVLDRCLSYNLCIKATNFYFQENHLFFLNGKEEPKSSNFKLSDKDEIFLLPKELASANYLSEGSAQVLYGNKLPVDNAENPEPKDDSVTISYSIRRAPPYRTYRSGVRAFIAGLLKDSDTAGAREAEREVRFFLESMLEGGLPLMIQLEEFFDKLESGNGRRKRSHADNKIGSLSACSAPAIVEFYNDEGSLPRLIMPFFCSSGLNGDFLAAAEDDASNFSLMINFLLYWQRGFLLLPLGLILENQIKNEEFFSTLSVTKQAAVILIASALIIYLHHDFCERFLDCSYLVLNVVIFLLMRAADLFIMSSSINKSLSDCKYYLLQQDAREFFLRQEKMELACCFRDTVIIFLATYIDISFFTNDPASENAMRNVGVALLVCLSSTLYSVFLLNENKKLLKPTKDLYTKIRKALEAYDCKGGGDATGYTSGQLFERNTTSDGSQVLRKRDPKKTTTVASI